MSGTGGNEVAWVKLGKIWWPGKLLKTDEWTEQMKAEVELLLTRKTSVKADQIHIVKFLNEEEYEITSIPSQILLNVNEEKKHDLIKRAISSMKGSSLADNREKFKTDVLDAERLIDPNADLTDLKKLLDGETLDKRPIAGAKYADIFPTAKPEKPLSPPSTTPKGKGALKFNFPSSRIVTKASSKPPSKIAPLPCDPSKRYKCQKCAFSADRLNVIVAHSKFCNPTPAQQRRIAASSASSSPAASKASATPSPKPKPLETVSSLTTPSPVETPKRRPGRPPRKSVPETNANSTPSATSVPTSSPEKSKVIPTRASTSSASPKKRGRRSKKDKLLSDKQKAEILNDWNSSSEEKSDSDDELAPILPPTKPPELFLFGSEKNKKRKTEAVEDVGASGDKESTETGGDASQSKSGVADEDQPPILKKPRTDKELSDAFDSLLKTTQMDNVKKFLKENDDDEMEVDEEDLQMSDIEEDAHIVMKKADATTDETEEKEIVSSSPQKTLEEKKEDTDKPEPVVKPPPVISTRVTRRRSAISPEKTLPETVENGNINEKTAEQPSTEKSKPESEKSVKSSRKSERNKKDVTLEKADDKITEKPKVATQEPPKEDKKKESPVKQTSEEKLNATSKEEIKSNESSKAPVKPTPVSSQNKTASEETKKETPVQKVPVDLKTNAVAEVEAPKAQEKKKAAATDAKKAKEVTSTPVATRSSARNKKGEKEEKVVVASKPETTENKTTEKNVSKATKNNLEEKAVKEKPAEKKEETPAPPPPPVVVQDKEKKEETKQTPKSPSKVESVQPPPPVPVPVAVPAAAAPSVSPSKSKTTSVVTVKTALPKESPPSVAAKVLASVVKSPAVEVKKQPPPPPVVVNTVKVSSGKAKVEPPTKSPKKTVEEKKVSAPAVAQPTAPSTPVVATPAKPTAATAKSVSATAAAAPTKASPAAPAPTPGNSQPVQIQKKPTAAVKPLVDTKEKEITVKKEVKGKGVATSASLKKELTPPVSGQVNQQQQQQQQQQEEGEDGKKSPALVTQRVVHLVPVENQDGTITYMLLSLDNGNDNAEVVQPQVEGQDAVLRIDKLEPAQGNSQRPLNENELEGVFLDKNVENANQIVNALVVTQSDETQTTATATDAVAPTGVVQPSIVVSEGVAGLAQEATGEDQPQQVYYMTEDGSILDPQSLGLTLEQLQQLLNQ